MRLWALAAAAVALSATAATAQQPFVYKPIDTTQLVVQPTDTAAAVTTGATNGTLRSIGRAVAGTIESNGFVRTFNNIFGRRANPPVSQAGFSSLPLTSSFQSTRYPNTFGPQMPILSTYGQQPNIPLPTGTIISGR